MGLNHLWKKDFDEVKGENKALKAELAESTSQNDLLKQQVQAYVEDFNAEKKESEDRLEKLTNLEVRFATLQDNYGRVTDRENKTQAGIQAIISAYRPAGNFAGPVSLPARYDASSNRQPEVARPPPFSGGYVVRD